MSRRRWSFHLYGAVAVISVLMFLGPIVIAMGIDNRDMKICGVSWWWCSLAGVVLSNIGCPLIAILDSSEDQ